MDQTIRAIVRLLEEGRRELKIAAAQILGELRVGDPAALKALAARFNHDEAYLAPFVLEALSQIGTPEAIAHLVERLRTGGALADRAGVLLAQMGPQVTTQLAPLFDTNDTELQSRVLAILGRHRDREALVLLKKALLHQDPGISAQAAHVLHGHLGELPDKLRTMLFEGLEKALSANHEVAPGSAAHALSVLGAVDQSKGRTILLRFTGVKYAPVVRQAALRALQGAVLTPTQKRQLLTCVTEDDMTHVARPAMRLLEGTDQWDSTANDVLDSLLEDAEDERRLFALRALRGWHSERMAKVCIELLLESKAEFQEAAIAALQGNGKAADGLLRALQAEKNVERARRIARALRGLGSHVDASVKKALVERACRLIVAGEPLGDTFLQAVVELDAEAGVAEVVEKGVRLRKSGRHSDCVTVLARLMQTERADVEARYQLAVARLLVDGQNGRGAKKEHGDAAMGYLSALVREGFPLLDRLRKETQVDAEDLLRVGRHFAEAVGPERRFASDLLHFLATRHARKKAGEEARLTLRSEGL